MFIMNMYRHLLNLTIRKGDYKWRKDWFIYLQTPVWMVG